MITGNDVMVGVQIVVGSVAVVSLLVSTRRNTRKDTKADTEFQTALKANVDEINKALTDPDDGLKAIRNEVGCMKNNCASVTSGFSERMKRAEADIHEIRQKDRCRTTD
jgi:hypothetical protein